MAGNEDSTLSYLFNHCLNRENVALPLLGTITEIGIPASHGRLELVKEESDLQANATQSSGKKADFYLNGRGISHKQEGGSFAYNRIQRKDLFSLLKTTLEFPDYQQIIKSLDIIVGDFHHGKCKDTFDPIEVLGSPEKVRRFMAYLMMAGSPTKVSPWPAELILTAPRVISDVRGIHVYTFEEYFTKFQSQLKLRFRRSWYGQKSKTEHGRARAISKQPGNSPWIFSDVQGSPASWNLSIPESTRFTAYYLMIEKKN